MSSLREAQTQVRTFHRATGSTIGEWPEIRDAELRAKLIAEEAAETISALGFDCYISAGPNDWDRPIIFDHEAAAPSLTEVADGIADSIYVLLGTAVACGIDLEPIWQAVHESNMAKVGGPKRADGKAGKPEGWVPPDVAGLIEQQAFRSTDCPDFPPGTVLRHYVDGSHEIVPVEGAWS